MLSEAVLSVERTGLPYLTILVDDSASERIADQYENPEVQTALDALAAGAAASAGKAASPDDPAGDRQGLDLRRTRPSCSASWRSNTRSGSIASRMRRRLLTEVDRPGRPGTCRPSWCATSKPRGPVAAGRRGPPGADRAARRTPFGDRPLHRRPDDRGRVARQGLGAGRAQGRAALHDRPRERRAGPRHRADRAPGRRRRVRRRRRPVPGQAAGAGLPGREGVVRLKELDARLQATPRRARELESDRGRGSRRRPAQAGRAGLPAQEDGRANVHPRSRASAPRAPDRQQPDRARRHGPEGEAQGPATSTASRGTNSAI